MMFEAPKSDLASAEDDAEREEQPSLRRAVGPLSDYEEGERVAVADNEPTRFTPASETEAEKSSRQLREFIFQRDPSDEVDVDYNRQQVETRLGGLSELKKEHEKKAEQGDGASAAEVKIIESAEKHLTNELEHIGRADAYNKALDVFSEMKHSDPENLDAVIKTGKDKHGNEVNLFDAKKSPLNLNRREMKRLAGLAKSGVRHVTWEELSELVQTADTIIHEAFISTAKRMLGLKS